MIYRYLNIVTFPKRKIERTDYVPRRKALDDREFAPYEKMFHKVHQEIKDGKRRIVEFKDADAQLIAKTFTSLMAS